MTASRPELEDQLAYLRKSVEDLERELAAGDVSGADYERLRARYERQAGETERELARHQAPVEPEGVTPRAGGGEQARARRSRVLASRRARLLTGGGAFACFAVAAVLLALDLAGVGPFRTTPPLPVEARVQIMLAEASVLGSRGEVPQALATYDRVLALRPAQPVALADGGWLARLAGLSQHQPALLRNGDAEIEAAVRADPGFAVARAYDGVMLLRDRHEARQALREFQAMLADRPSATLVWSVKNDAIAAFRSAGKPVPARIANAHKP